MGTFGINIPLSYGEGDDAFMGLQEEVMRQRDDQRIFAWEARSSGNSFRGLLATSPAEFENSGNITIYKSDEVSEIGIGQLKWYRDIPLAHMVTSRDIEIGVENQEAERSGIHVALLACIRNTCEPDGERPRGLRTDDCVTAPILEPTQPCCYVCLIMLWCLESSTHAEASWGAA